MNNKFNHNNRLTQLERQVNRLFKIIQAAGLTDNFVPLAQAAKILGVNPWVIRNRIKAGKAEPDKHYRMNGNRYLINVEAWESLLISDLKAKQN